MNPILIKAKNILLIIALILCGIFCFTQDIPQLPSALGASMMLGENEQIKIYLQYNLFAILFFALCICMGVLLLRFGLFFRTEAPDDKAWNIFLTLSGFMVLAGIWMITDSFALEPFVENKYAVVLISFLSFMLMALVLVKLFRYIFPGINHLEIYDLLLSLNIVVFIVFVLTRQDVVFYLMNLAIHHVLDILLIILVIKNYFKEHTKEQNPFRSSLFFGLFLFSCFCALALIAFLLQQKQLYSAFYGIGLLCLSYAVLKALLVESMIAYKNQITLSAYKKLAYTDPLCVIGNRNAFYKEQQKSLYEPELCYIILDMNDLKKVNDNLGHSAGDQLISSAASLICQVFDSCGKCFRIGGDEFAVIVTQMDEESVIKKLRELEEQINDFNCHSQMTLSLAYGYAIRQSSEETVDELFHRADMAMYKHKEICKKS